MEIKISESAYKYLGYTVIDDDKAGLWRVKDSEGKYLDAEFSTDVEAEEYIDSMTEAVAVKNKDNVRTDLSKVKGSMTNTLTAHKDEIATATSVKELVMNLKDWFKADGIDTPASNRLIMNVMKQRDLINAQYTVYNSILAGSGDKVITEDSEDANTGDADINDVVDTGIELVDDNKDEVSEVETKFNEKLSKLIAEIKELIEEAHSEGLEEISIDLEDVITILDK